MNKHKYFGYMGNILHVDLSSGEWEVQGLDSDAAKAYAGGLGLNAWLMDRSWTRGTEALAPENPIILGAGPLVGTNTPGSAKTVATTRFPLNGTISESVGSMRFALNLKGAGFDHVIVTGRASRPVVLRIQPGVVRFEDAWHLWGKDIYETTDAIKSAPGGKSSSVIAIGPAGENRLAFAIALVDRASTLGRGGLAAIMGSKNLKAIVAAGDGRPHVARPDALKKILSEMRGRLKRWKNHPRVLELGILENWDNYVHQLAAFRNFSAVVPPEKMGALYGPDVYREFEVKHFGCPSCFTPDKDRLEIREGPHKGFKTTSTAYLNSALFGHLFDLNRPEDRTVSVRLLDRLDRMGMDFFTFGGLLDFLVTQVEEGRLDPSRFALPLKRDEGTVLRWLEGVAQGKEEAEVLKEGWRSLLDYLGQEYRPFAPVIKDCEVLWEPRLAGLGTMEFEQIVSLKGPRSASAGSPTYLPGLTEDSLPLFARHLDRMGADQKAIARIMDSPLGFNVGRMSRYSEDWYAILSSLGICNRHFVNRFYSYEICSELFDAVTGFQTDQDHLRRCARDSWDLLKRLNRAEGFGPEDDAPPDMWFTPMTGPKGEPLVMKDYFGKKQLDREDVRQLVSDYYDERGWGSGRADEGKP